MRYFSLQHNQRLMQHLTARPFMIGILLCLIVSFAATADTSQSIEDKCGESMIRYQDDPSLPRAERLEKMHQAFIDSVNRFEACELSDPTLASENAGAGGGGDAGSDGVSGNAATASQEMQGTEAPETFPETTAEAFSDENDLEKPPGIIRSSASAANGATPEDIPAANNDDAVAAQIRLAAENETDPEIREKLWNEYRKYKGMEIVE